MNNIFKISVFQIYEQKNSQYFLSYFSNMQQQKYFSPIKIRLQFSDAKSEKIIQGIKILHNMHNILQNSSNKQKSMIVNPFKAHRSIRCQHNKQNKEPSHISKDIMKVKVANPFQREFLIAPPIKKTTQRSYVSLMGNKNKSLSLTNLHYNQQLSDSRSKSSSKLRRGKFGSIEKMQMEFKKQKQFDLERKRINLFGPQIFRMKFQQKNKNQQYFGILQHEQNQNNFKQKLNIFDKSYNIYGNQQKFKIQQTDQKAIVDVKKGVQNRNNRDTNNKQKKHFKAKKMLSWNQDLNKVSMLPKSKGSSQKQIPQFAQQQVQQIANNRAPTFGIIRLSESQKINELPSAKIKSFSSSLKKYDFQRVQDYVIQGNDDFRLQRNSESSNFRSSSSQSNNNFMGSGIISNNNNYNLNYNSNFSYPSNMNQHKSFEYQEKRGLDPKKMSYNSQISQKSTFKNYAEGKIKQIDIKSSFMFDGKKFQLIHL